MPLPKPRKDEDQDDFMKRCMGDEIMRKEYPDNDQRYAVCNRQWETKEEGAAVNEHKDFSQVPASACLLVVGEFEIGDNGENAKSAPVRLVARSGKPIEHWFWGRIVHDLAGMHLHKSRIPIDYVHDSKEVIGYLNRFDRESGDLVTSGALVPFKDSDRATEIIHKMKAGVPYEASINFGGDGLKIQELGEGEVAEVNGAMFDGPGVVVREWPLRGVAICPYGADMNTESSVFADKNKVFSAAVVSAPDSATQESADMASESVEVAAPVEPPKTEDQQEQTTTEELKIEEQPVEATPAEATEQAVEAETPEGGEQEPAAPDVPAPAEQEPEAQPVPALSRDELTRIADEFGADIAMQTVRDGGNYESALKLAYAAEKARREAAEAHAAEMVASQAGIPAPVKAADKKKTSLFNTGK